MVADDKKKRSKNLILASNLIQFSYNHKLIPVPSLENYRLFIAYYGDTFIATAQYFFY